jgi:hypothetical protein
MQSCPRSSSLSHRRGRGGHVPVHSPYRTRLLFALAWLSDPLHRTHFSSQTCSVHIRAHCHLCRRRVCCDFAHHHSARLQLRAPVILPVTPFHARGLSLPLETSKCGWPSVPSPGPAPRDTVYVQGALGADRLPQQPASHAAAFRCVPLTRSCLSAPWRAPWRMVSSPAFESRFHRLSVLLAEFHATLACRCLRLLAMKHDTTSSRGHSGSQRRWPFGVFFVAAVFVLGTVNFGAQVAFVLDAFAGRGTAFTGGAAAYASASAGLPASQISNVCCILTIIFSDGLLVSFTKRRTASQFLRIHSFGEPT